MQTGADREFPSKNLTLPREDAHLLWSDARGILANDVFAQRRRLSVRAEADRAVRVYQLAFVHMNPPNQSVQTWTSHSVLSLHKMPIVAYIGLPMPLVVCGQEGSAIPSMGTCRKTCLTWHCTSILCLHLVVTPMRET